jgi:uncharacterized protein YceH (UPF0502 family)
VIKLPRVPGERESRWMHLLCGEVNIEELRERAAASASSSSDDAAASFAEIDALRSEQKQLSAKVDRLQAMVERMAKELGIEPDAA